MRRKLIIAIVIGLIALLGGSWYDGHAAGNPPPRTAHRAKGNLPALRLALLRWKFSP